MGRRRPPIGVSRLSAVDTPFAPATGDRAEHPSEASGRAGTRTPARRIGLFGHFGTGNIGNEASLEAVLAFVRRERPSAQLLCICSSPEATLGAYNLASVSIRRTGSATGWIARVDRLLAKVPSRALDFVRAFRQMRRLDLLIVPGTGILDDFGDRPGGMPYALFTWLAAARLAGCKVALISIGAGPIHNPLSRRLMIAAARMAHFRSFRDELSKRYVASCGVDTHNDPVIPDVAFALPPPEDESVRDGPVTVGVGVMNYWGWRSGAPEAEAASIHDTYIGKLADFVQRLLAKGYRVRLLLGHKWDSEAIGRVVARIDAASYDCREVICEPAENMRDLMRQIQQTDVVVTTRYHNVVAALCVARPVISLSYAEKNDALLDDVGLTGLHQHCETFSVDRLWQQLEWTIANRASLGATIAATVAEYRTRLSEQEIALIAQWL